MYCLLSVSAVLENTCWFFFSGSVCDASLLAYPTPSPLAGTYWRLPLPILNSPCVYSPPFIYFLLGLYIKVYCQFNSLYSPSLFSHAQSRPIPTSLSFPIPEDTPSWTCRRRCPTNSPIHNCAARLTLFIIPQCPSAGAISPRYHLFLFSLPRLLDVLRTAYLWCS